MSAPTPPQEPRAGSVLHELPLAQERADRHVVQVAQVEGADGVAGGADEGLLVHVEDRVHDAGTYVDQI